MTKYHLSSSEYRVSLWLSRPLPNEPKGELMKARNELHAKLRQLRAPDFSILDASYHSVKDGIGFDIENVLIYNVRSGAFKNAVKHGIRFRRVRKQGGFKNQAQHWVNEQCQSKIAAV